MPTPAQLADLNLAAQHAALQLKYAQSDGCRLDWARQLVDARFARGDYAHVLQTMDAATREAMARAIVKENVDGN